MLSYELIIWMFPKIVVPQIIHFNRVFHYKPSILGYHYFWKHPYTGNPLGFLFKTLGVAPLPPGHHQDPELNLHVLLLLGRPHPIHSWSFGEGFVEFGKHKNAERCLEGWLNSWIYLVYANNRNT